MIHKKNHSIEHMNTNLIAFPHKDDPVCYVEDVYYLKSQKQYSKNLHVLQNFEQS